MARPVPLPVERKPLRLLVVLPSWVGDVVMATPALRLLRSHLTGSLIGGLMRPGLDELLAGSDLIDQYHVDRARGVMGPKLVAAKLRPQRYESALLLTNSFSTALITRLAFIPERIGYDRDGRGLLLTRTIRPRMRPAAAAPPSGAKPGVLSGLLSSRRFAPVSAVDYYLCAARVLLSAAVDADACESPLPGEPSPRLELGVSPEQEEQAARVLNEAGVDASARYAVLNPGANNPAKRWPAERFIELGRVLARDRGLRVLVSGSPNERELVESIADGIDTGPPARALTRFGLTLGALKGIVRGASLMVTNDTGPRHIAAAFGVPTVALFGPTDPRWTTLPGSDKRYRTVVADPSLPPDEVADDHPERCRIDRIGLETVVEAVREVTGDGWV